jgi:hypothetical protein
MSQRTADLDLVDILDAAEAIAHSLQGVSFDEFVGQKEKRIASAEVPRLQEGPRPCSPSTTPRRIGGGVRGLHPAES